MDHIMHRQDVGCPSGILSDGCFQARRWVNFCSHLSSFNIFHKLRNGDQLVGRLICRDFWASQKVLFELF